MFSTIWTTVFFNPLLNLMIIFYHFLGNNLGLAILGIAVLARIAMIPLVKKQTNMTKKMSALKPQLEAIQKKYANNKEKLSQEQVKLYKKEGYNPLGCIGTFIPQLIILSVLIGVIRAVTQSNLDGLYPFVQNIIDFTKDFKIETSLFPFLDVEWRNLTGNINDTSLNFINLTKSYKDVSTQYESKVALEALPYIGLTILVGVSQYFTSHFTQKMQNISTPKKKKTGDESPMDGMQASMQKSTMFLLPLMTMFFTISMPAALGFYWMIQSLLLVVQYMTLDFNKAKKGVQNLWDTISKKQNKL